MFRFLPGILTLVLFAGLVNGQPRQRESVHYNILENGDSLLSYKVISRHNGDSFLANDMYSYDDNKWKLQSTVSTWYNSAKQTVRRESRDYNDQTGKLSIETEQQNTYLNDTLLLHSDFIRKSYGETVLVYKSQTERTYNAQGKLVKEIYRNQEQAGQPWRGNSRELDYDENGCSSEIRFYYLENEEWVLSARHVIESDSRCRQTLFVAYSIQNGMEMENFARLNEYLDSESTTINTVYTRYSTTSAWQLFREYKTRYAADSVIQTDTFFEQTYEARYQTIHVNGLKAQETSEIAYEDFIYRLTFMINFYYENGLEKRTEWEERTADEVNEVTTFGESIKAYNASDQLISAESFTYTGNGTSYYGTFRTYRCDGALTAIRDISQNEDYFYSSLTQNSYYTDAPCDGADFDTAIRLYPNPASNQLWVYSKEDLTDAQLDIIDSSGRTLYSNNLTEPSYGFLNISGMAPGIYILRIRGLSGTRSARFIKTK